MWTAVNIFDLAKANRCYESYPNNITMDEVAERKRKYLPVPSIDSYEVLLDNFGYNKLLQVDDRDYQGDSRVLYYDHKTNRYGHLQFGLGSCSGCDMLQGCNTYQEIADLANEMLAFIKWFSIPKEALNYFTEHDWEGDYSWRQKEQREYISQVIEILTNLVKKL